MREPINVRKGPYLMITPGYALHTKVKRVGDLVKAMYPQEQVRQEVEGYRRYLRAVGERAPQGYVPRKLPLTKRMVGWFSEERMLNEELDHYDKYRKSMSRFPSRWYKNKPR